MNPNDGQRGGTHAALPEAGPSLETARAFLAALFSEVSADHYGVVFTKPSNRSRFFSAGDLDRMSAYALAARQNQDVYVGVGFRARDHGPYQRGGSDTVAGIVGFWADLDLAKPSAHKPYFSSLDAITTFLRTLPFAPTTVVTTGGGLHAWWLFREPWYFNDTADRKHAATLVAAWQRFLMVRARAQGIAIDATFDLARVLRVPGTLNHKHGVSVELTGIHGPRLNPSDVEPFVATYDDGSAVRSLDRTTRLVTTAFILHAVAEPPVMKFTALRTNDEKFSRTWRHERPDLRDQSASAYDQSLASMAARVGWSDQEIVDLLIAHRRQHGCELKLRSNYYARTIARARVLTAPMLPGVVAVRPDGLRVRTTSSSAANLLRALPRAYPTR